MLGLAWLPVIPNSTLVSLNCQEDSIDNIRPFRATPKKTTEKYRLHTVEIVYRPELLTWHWEFSYVPEPVVFKGTARTEEEARRLARKKLDEILT